MLGNAETIVADGEFDVVVVVLAHEHADRAALPGRKAVLERVAHQFVDDEPARNGLIDGQLHIVGLDVDQHLA